MWVNPKGKLTLQGPTKCALRQVVYSKKAVLFIDHVRAEASARAASLTIAALASRILVRPVHSGSRSSGDRRNDSFRLSMILGQYHLADACALLPNKVDPMAALCKRDNYIDSAVLSYVKCRWPASIQLLYTCWRQYYKIQVGRERLFGILRHFHKPNSAPTIRLGM